jgi:hypothetical protein
MLKASGSTAQENAMNRFVKAFAQACPGQSVNYTPNGSGAGVDDFMSSRTDFSGSDSPLNRGEYAKANQRCGSPPLNLPMVFGPIAIAYNVNGLTSLNLNGPVTAQIFNGQISMWNDAAIQLLNLGVKLPAEPIRVVFRSDESGTTDNFQKYLDTASAGTWGFPAGKKFNGGVGEGAKGNDGAAAVVKSTEGAITSGDRGNRGSVPRHVGEQLGGDDSLSGRRGTSHHVAAIRLTRIGHQPDRAGRCGQCPACDHRVLDSGHNGAIWRAARLFAATGKRLGLLQ